MEEIYIKAAVSEFIRTIKEEATALLADAKAEVGHFLDDGIKGYLEIQREKYSHIKTILHRVTPRYLYDIYQPLKLQKENQEVKTDSITMLFESCSCITVIGDAGSGKSTLVKHLFLNCLKEKYRIPIIIELQHLNNYDNDLESYILEKIFENKLSPNKTILERLLNNGKFAFFLDGYDEIHSDSKYKIITNLNIFINKYNKNKFLLTSRPYSNVELVPLFHNHQVKKLTSTDIDGFVRKQLIDTVTADKILASIKEGKAQHIKSFLSNPLLLSLYILTFQSDSSIPNKKYLFYRRVWDVLFYEHDSLSKLNYERKRSTKLTQEEFEEVLKRFSFLSYFENKYDFDRDYLDNRLNGIKSKLSEIKFANNDFISDLKSAINLWVDDSGILSFAHRSLQEYFAASYIKNLKDDHKKKAYGKIQENLRKRHFTSYDNFLSLCEEMDKISYFSYLLQPALRYIDSKIDKTSHKAKIKSLLAIFFKSLNVYLENAKGKKEQTSLSLGEGMQYFFAIDNREKLIHNVFEISSKNQNIIKYILQTQPDKSHGKLVTYSINFTNLDDKILDEIIKSDTNSYLETVARDIESRLAYISQNIHTSNKSEEELIDFI